MAAPLVLGLALAGVTVGSAAALSGIGLVVCYRATGVLNVAQGAIAMVIAYLLRQTVVVWHWPRALAVPCCLLLFAPGLGVLLDVLVFRPLQRRRAGTGETLVAGLGVFVLLISAAYLVWGPTPRADSPALLPHTGLASVDGLDLSLDTVAEPATVLLLALGLGAVTRWTRFGTSLRAVVDDRRLAELGGLDADMLSSVGWAFGSFSAGLTGVLLAPGLQLDPYGLPLLVMETMAVAILAGLRSLPLTIAAALGLGIAQSELTQFHPSGLAQPLLESTGANLFVLALLAAVLAPRLLPSAERGSPEPVLMAGQSIIRLPGAAPQFTVLALLLPLALRPDDLRAALQLPALAVVLLSIVVVTGYAGQVSLGQAGYAGAGALVTGLLAGGGVPGLPRLPAPLALLVAVLLAALLGFLVGRPTVHRLGLALALASFAVGTALSRLVFQQPFAATDLRLDRTGLLGHDHVFYLLELLLLGGARNTCARGWGSPAPSSRARSSPGSPSPRTSSSARSRRGASRPARPRRASIAPWPCSAWVTSATTRRALCPAARCGWWNWAGHWPPVPGYCCWTSPPPGWTTPRPSGWRCCSASWPTTAWRYCWSSTTATWWTGSPTRAM